MTAFVIDETQVGQRLDRFLAERSDRSRSALQRDLLQGHICVNEQPARASYALRLGDKVTVTVPELAVSLPLGPLPELTIIYQDDDVLVIDKPAGLTVHPGSGTRQVTLADAISTYTSDDDGDRSGIVHRLDKDTSGVMIVARTPAAKTWLQEQFRARKVEKTYLALVTGRLRPETAVIRLPLARSGRDPLRREPSARGKAAETAYHVQRDLPGYSLVEATPKTGRTHQLRAHFAATGHAIAGDMRYGAPAPPVGLKRQFLHATSLGLALPGGEFRTFTSPLSSDLATVLQTLEQRV